MASELPSDTNESPSEAEQWLEKRWRDYEKFESTIDTLLLENQSRQLQTRDEFQLAFLKAEYTQLDTLLQQIDAAITGVESIEIDVSVKPLPDSKNRRHDEPQLDKGSGSNMAAAIAGLGSGTDKLLSALVPAGLPDNYFTYCSKRQYEGELPGFEDNEGGETMFSPISIPNGYIEFHYPSENEFPDVKKIHILATNQSSSPQ